MGKGKLIIIESGSDASGKATQSQRLYERLIQEGKKCLKITFPDYDSDSSALVKMYLNGDFGKNPSAVNPYISSTFYAADRYASYKTKWGEFYNNGGIIISDRYTTSNLIYQSALIDDIEEKKKFIDYISDLEYNKLGIRKPDKVIFLTAPFDIVTNLRKQRPDNEGIINDVYERDLEFMKKIYDNALFVADYLSWKKVECSDNGKMKDINNIHEKIYNLVKN